jgi:hypothetical protein
MPEDIISQGLGEERDRLGAVENMLVEGDKVSPEEVNYGPAPEGSPDTCGTCASFELPGNDRSTCMKVSGEVQATGLCDIFEPAMDGQGLPGTADEGLLDDPLANLLPGMGN